jgi:hypothetical protein
MKRAADDLQKNQKEKAAPKQKSAAKKMKEMSQSMASEMQGGEKYKPWGRRDNGSALDEE